MSEQNQKPEAADQSPKKEFNLKPISMSTKFPFSCYPGISCFNRCCREIDVILAPNDVLRMKNKLGISSSEFMKLYADLQVIKGTEVPLVKLRMNNDSEHRTDCVFLDGDKGCKVYEARPMVCRYYPVGLATLDPTEGESDAPYFIIEEGMCQGHKEKSEWVIGQWFENQNAEGMEEINRPWLRMVARLKTLQSESDSDKKMSLFLMALYDLDVFRSMVQSEAFTQKFELRDSKTYKKTMNDEEMLAFAYEWLVFILFAEGKIKPINAL